MKRFWNWLLGLFRKKKVAPKRTINIPAPLKQKVSLWAQVSAWRHYRIKKHPLHKHHFGTFSPCRPFHPKG